jgi:hypothetical protein
MALKIALGDFSIVSVRPSIGRVTTTLKLWEAEDNTVTDPPIRETQITEDNVKIYVEGETPEALADRIKKKIKPSAQSYIDDYQNESEKIDNVTPAFETMITQVDGELTSKEKA